MSLTVWGSSSFPCTPLLVKDGVFDFDVGSDLEEEPDDNNTLTPLLRRITATPKLYTPKSILLSPAFTFSPANAPATASTTPTIINGRLAPPHQQHYSKTPQRRGSPLAGFRRLRSPRPTSPHIGQPSSTRLEVPIQWNYVAGNNSQVDTCKVDSKSCNLAGRRSCRKLRLQELQQRYAAPFEIDAVPKPLSPRVGYLLRRVGMIRYRSLFEMEEVDFVVFRTLTQNDLQVLGVGNAEDREEIYKAVLMADVLVMERF